MYKVSAIKVDFGYCTACKSKKIEIEITQISLLTDVILFPKLYVGRRKLLRLVVI